MIMWKRRKPRETTHYGHIERVGLGDEIDLGFTHGFAPSLLSYALGHRSCPG